MPDYKTHSDEQLVTLLQAGDETAFTEIYNRYWEVLFAISYSHCQQKQASEEVVQEIFMLLWDKRTKVKIDHLGAYLATAAKFSIFKRQSREARRKELLLKNVRPINKVDEEAKITALFLEEYVKGIVEQLPEKCQIVYKLRREEHLSIPEIADKLNIADKTAANHLTRALKVIKDALKGAHNSILLFF